jgi:hypothetical protein
VIWCFILYWEIIIKDFTSKFYEFISWNYFSLSRLYILYQLFKILNGVVAWCQSNFKLNQKVAYQNDKNMERKEEIFVVNEEEWNISPII